MNYTFYNYSYITVNKYIILKKTEKIRFTLLLFSKFSLKLLIWVKTAVNFEIGDK